MTAASSAVYDMAMAELTRYSRVSAAPSEQEECEDTFKSTELTRERNSSSILEDPMMKLR